MQSKPNARSLVALSISKVRPTPQVTNYDTLELKKLMRLLICISKELIGAIKLVKKQILRKRRFVIGTLEI